MKVKELLEELSKVDPERDVILQKDGEGNGFSPLYGLWEGSYLPDSTWSGEVGLETLTEEDVQAGFTEDDVVDGTPVVVFVPTN